MCESKEQKPMTKISVKLALSSLALTYTRHVDNQMYGHRVQKET